MAGHRSLEPAVVVRIHPGQSAPAPKEEPSSRVRFSPPPRSRWRRPLRCPPSPRPRFPPGRIAACLRIRLCRRRRRNPIPPRSTTGPLTRSGASSACACSICPVSIEPGSSPCDEVIGRMCYWHGDNHTRTGPGGHGDHRGARGAARHPGAQPRGCCPETAGSPASASTIWWRRAGRTKRSAVARACAAPEPDLVRRCCAVSHSIASNASRTRSVAYRGCPWKRWIRARPRSGCRLTLLLERADASGLGPA